MQFVGCEKLEIYQWLQLSDVMSVSLWHDGEKVEGQTSALIPRFPQKNPLKQIKKQRDSRAQSEKHTSHLLTFSSPDRRQSNKYLAQRHNRFIRCSTKEPESQMKQTDLTLCSTFLSLSSNAERFRQAPWCWQLDETQQRWSAGPDR